jgi:hypothetical protein
MKLGKALYVIKTGHVTWNSLKMAMHPLLFNAYHTHLNIRMRQSIEGAICSPTRNALINLGLKEKL